MRRVQIHTAQSVTTQQLHFSVVLLKPLHCMHKLFVRERLLFCNIFFPDNPSFHKIEHIHKLVVWMTLSNGRRKVQLPLEANRFLKLLPSIPKTK